MTDVGTSTLQPSGQTYGTDTINYIEYSTETDYDSVTSGDNYEWGNASEVYTDSDTCTVFNSNGVITSDDLFTLYVSHDVFGGDEGSTANSTMSESWVDNANDSDVTSDNGTSSPSGLAITFTNTDISNDVGMSNETVYGSNGYTAGGGNANTATNYTSGYYDSSGEGSNYSTLSSYSCTNNQWNTGNVWISGIEHPFTIGVANNETIVFTVSGPSAVTTTLTSIDVSSNSSTYGPGGSYGAIPPTGTGITWGFAVAERVGNYAIGGIHNGSQNRGFDVTQGLVSALGGQDASALQFTGSDEQPIGENGTIAINDFDGTENAGGPPNTPWESHPSTVGYVRETRAAAAPPAPKAR